MKISLKSIGCKRKGWREVVLMRNVHKTDDLRPQKYPSERDSSFGDEHKFW